MAEKDMTEKTLESYNDVFADIVNVLLFDGKCIVKENELEDAAPRSQYKSGRTVHEQERDVSKYWRDGSIRFALYGIENQTNIDKDISLRISGYDGVAYRAQLFNKKCKNRYPVVTLVLYFGYTRRWNKPLSLRTLLDIPQALQPFVHDYGVHLFEIAWLSDEKVAQFKSDFRIVADYFVQMRKNKEYKASPWVITHVDAILKMMAAVSGNNQFEKLQEAYQQDKRKGATMKGMFETMQEQILTQVAKNMLADNQPVESIKKYTQLSEAKIKKLQKK